MVALMLLPKHEHRLLGFVLISLHLSLWSNDFLAYVFFFLHCLLFLLWQPLWRRGEVINKKHPIFLGIFIIAATFFLNPWIMTGWQIFLIGLMGGRDLVWLRDRFANLIAIVFLIVELFAISIHQLFVMHITSEHVWFILPNQLLLQYGLLLIPGILLFINTDNTREYRYHVDFLHGLIVSLLITIIALGSLVLMFSSKVDYPFAIFQFAIAVALFLLITSWLWAMLTHEKNADRLWTQHLFYVGSSFEEWLDNIAQPQNYKGTTPQEFLRISLKQLMALPWITGIKWRCSLYSEKEQLGEIAKKQVMIEVKSDAGTLEVTVCSHYRINSSQYFLVKLLIQLVERFHQTKRRQDAFAQNAHLQAIYETGAKLTHDIKNLLQTLHGMSTAIETCQPSEFGDTQRFLQGQIPNLAQRLKRLLDNLQEPSKLTYSLVPVNLWWENLCARYGKSPITFSEDIKSKSPPVPESLFYNVAENLLQNALMKRSREPELQIDVELIVDEDQKLQFLVCDDGSEIPEQIAANLLAGPVPSREGYGIGLYQAAKHLANSGFGYHLRILSNEAGNVCFELTNID